MSIKIIIHDHPSIDLIVTWVHEDKLDFFKHIYLMGKEKCLMNSLTHIVLAFNSI